MKNFSIFTAISFTLILNACMVKDKEVEPIQKFSIEENIISCKNCSLMKISTNNDYVFVSSGDSIIIYAFDGTNITQINSINLEDCNGISNLFATDKYLVIIYWRRDPDSSEHDEMVIYEKNSGEWQKKQVFKNVPVGFTFGILDLDGDILAVGNPDYSCSFSGQCGTEYGSVYLYKRSNDQWDFIKYINAHYPSPNDGFGRILGVYNGYILVGFMGDRQELYNYNMSLEYVRTDTLLTEYIARYGDLFFTKNSWSGLNVAFRIDSQGNFIYDSIAVDDYKQRYMSIMAVHKDHAVLGGFDEMFYILQNENGIWSIKTDFTPGTYYRNYEASDVAFQMTKDFVVMSSYSGSTGTQTISFHSY